MVKFRYPLSSQSALLRSVLVAATCGLLVAGCSDSKKETSKAASGPPCTNPSAPVKLPAAPFSQATRQGWNFSGPGFPEQKKDIPMGKSNNQLYSDQPVPDGATAARIKLAVSGTAAAATLILDTIWYTGKTEVGRASPSMVLGASLSGELTTTQAISAQANQVTLIVRPWREADGIVTLGEGELVWCNK